MGFLKKHNGNVWEDVPLKKWNNSAWVEPEVKSWNGTGWDILNKQQYVTTFNAEWSHTYGANNTQRTNSGEKMYQGQYSSVDNSWGLMRSLCGFDEASMRAVLSGARIDKIELYLRAEHWYYHAGGTAVIGYHNHESKPTIFSQAQYGAKVQKYTARDQAIWIEMPIGFGEGIRDRKYTGFSIYADTTSASYYGNFYGAGEGLSKPKLKITYSK